MLYQKIKNKLVVALVVVSMIAPAVVVAVPHASAATTVDQKYVAACKNFMEASFCNGLKQSWVNSCSAQWKAANKQQWSACIASAAKLNGGTVTKAGQDGVAGKVDPALGPGSCKNANDCGLVKKYVNPAINMLSAMVGVAVVFSIIWGAIQFSSSAGDPQKTAAAKDRILKALVALVSFVFLYAFLQWLMPGGLI
jgi:hypothetical protein